MRIIAIGLLLLLANLSGFAATRDAQWKSVEEAINKGLPQTAISNLQPIIVASLKDHAYAEAVKAIGRKIALEGNIQGNKPEEKITRLTVEIGKAPKEMVPVLDTLLGHWYWQYFQQNRWRFLQRTATTVSPGKDFTTWDLSRLFSEIDKQFQSALRAEAILKATPINTWDDLLVKGTMPDAYRPTLYDFLAHEALQFYTSGEQVAAKPQDDFELSATSPILDPVDGFLAWKTPSAAPGEEVSPLLRAIAIYQELLRFHQNDPAPKSALAAVDLERLNWGWNASFGESKDQRYKAALEAFGNTYRGSEVSAVALEHQARMFFQSGDFVTARALAVRGVETYPKSIGAGLCRNLIEEIEAKAVTISTERIWTCFEGSGSGLAAAEPKDAAGMPEVCPTIAVRFRNLSKVYFRAIPYDWETFLQKRHNRPENLSDAERREIIRQKPTLEWSENLPEATDFREKTKIVPAPGSLAPGFYFIAASPDPGFGEKTNVVSLASVWVSDLAMVTRSRNGQIEGFVLAATSGEPVAEANISVWHLDPTGNRVLEPEIVTDKNGTFAFKPLLNQNYLFRARFKGRAITSLNDLWSYNYQVDSGMRPDAQTVFFTDRAIYRPGQTIQYKGICLWVDQSKDNYEVLKREAQTVVLRDPNGKEIARQKVQANDFGSFTGSFVAPRDRVMGQFSLVVEGRAQGMAWLHVEEYKRPKFQVTLEPPKLAPKLDETVSLSGHAMTYAGAAVDGAPVRYHVIREARMPWWWGWYGRNWQGSQNQEIAHGLVTTETDGSFKVEFIAKPDPKIAVTNEPTFVYTVNVDVTDSVGETRSAGQSVRVGYTALEAMLTAPGWQTPGAPAEISVTTRTLDGQPQVAEGRVLIYSLRGPARAQPGPLIGNAQPFVPRGGPAESPEAGYPEDLSNPNNWPLDSVVAESGFTTDTNGLARLPFKLSVGAYRAIVETQDRFGKKVTGQLPLQILDPDARQLAIKIPFLLAAPAWDTSPGQNFSALWGTGYDFGRAFVEVEHRGRMIQRYWTAPGQTQQRITVPIDESMRGGFTVHLTEVRDNRAYLDSRHVDVPWANKDLEIKWEHFISKLQPNQKETYTAIITKAGQGKPGESSTAERKIAEMVATCYDESLDAFAPQNWLRRFSVFRQDFSTAQPQFANLAMPFQYAFGDWGNRYRSIQISYRSFPADLTAAMWGYGFRGMGGRAFSKSAALASAVPEREAVLADSAPGAPALALAKNEPASAASNLGIALGGTVAATPLPRVPGGPINLDQVTARKNLQETAFFFPQLISDSNGIVRMTFTMPEALTKWHFMAFAHDASLRSGFLEDHAQTAKDLMVQPNPPRFLREGDTVEFTVKVSNQSETVQTGSLRLTFTDAASGRPADKLLSLKATGEKPLSPTEQAFTIPAKESRGFAWRLTVPDGCGFLTYKAVGGTTTVSDGEEGAVPVLSRRVLITESLPLPIRGPGTRKFEFTSLLKSGGSKTLQNENLTVQMVSNPAWYAVLALPYLMEFPHECSEQVFNRLYANALARTVAGSDPKIHRVFEQWRNTPALDSPLEKNADLKSVALEETPWLRQAQSESQARKNVGVLFDDNRLNYELEHAAEKLAQMQLPDGAWPWFPGGPGNDYITLYVTTGFGRLRHLGADINVDPALRSLARLDTSMQEAYERIQKQPEPQKYVPSPTDALYLYGRSFFLKERPIGVQNKKAIDFFLNQSRKLWLSTNCRQSQGQLAIALARFSSFNGVPDPAPTAIMRSIKERSVTDEELGRFWRETELSWWWYRAPIETQALMIEAFDEVMHDQAAVEDCKVWLLKQKQTQDWKTTKATADAVYALLLRGRDLLSSEALVEVKLGGTEVTPGANKPSGKTGGAGISGDNHPEAGTGFYEVRFQPAEIKPKLGEIVVRKTDPGVAWGSVHWQYLQDISKVSSYDATPLKLVKSLFVKTAGKRGMTLEPVKTDVHVGDELVVRIELRVDRDMEYVHLKDQRASGTEPVNVLSQYKYQDGLAYYENTRDTATHFFIDYLPKGTYVFEYSTRVQLRGEYQTGLAEIQCLYAPEFGSHSGSVKLTVR